MDLDDVDVEAAQVGQRRVAGAEVVDRQLHAVGLERDQDRLALLEGDALGDLQDQRARIEVEVGQGALDVVDDPAVLELARRHVDAHFQGPGDALWNLFAAAQASRRTQRPSETMKPVSSARGMKTAGGITPRSG